MGRTLALGFWASPLVLAACLNPGTPYERPCYSGPEMTLGKGPCRRGVQLCAPGGGCSPKCSGEVVPSVETCDGVDNDCDGTTDEGVENVCGGCAALAGRPSEPCGACRVSYCASPDSLECAPLVQAVDAPCVAANGCPGRNVCGGDGHVSCETSLTPNRCGACTPEANGLIPGEVCSVDGSCTGRVLCTPDLAESFCYGGARNECGVCGPPISGLGTECFAANGCLGALACDHTGLATECVATVTANSCGLCGGPPITLYGEGGLGAACTAANGQVGRVVCNSVGDGTDCAYAVVTLSFDDTNADNVEAASLLEAHGVPGIFYVNSPRFEKAPRYMTLEQVRDLQRRGHEIGGHTLHHLHLPNVSAEVQSEEVCNDRANLLAAGLRVRSLAYPFGELDETTARVARECNFDSARRVGSIPTGIAESFSPGDVFQINAQSSVTPATTLEDLQRRVFGAERAGGWIFINMHHICDGCAANALSPGLLNTFLDWLVPRASSGTLVRTPRHVLPGEPNPAVTVAIASHSLLRNGSMEVDTDHDQAPDCWELSSDSRDPPWVLSVPRSGNTAYQVTVSVPFGDRRGLTSRYTTDCAPLAITGHDYEATAWYMSPDAAPIIAIYYRGAGGNWATLTESELLETSSAYRLALIRVRDVPPDAEALAVEIRIESQGTLTVDDVDLRDLSEASGNE